MVMELVTGLCAVNNAAPRMNEKREKAKALKVIDVTSV
jgi:hypothetical protein